jgi:gliding motility-associated-like protein
MKPGLKYIIIFLLTCTSFQAFCQPDTDPPLSPVFYLLSVQPETGRAELNWLKSSSSDVAGYIIYYFRNGEGYAIDTVFNPNAVSYIHTGSFASSRIESYVVAALDSAGNFSPLSNALNTMFVNAAMDTCNKTLEISWNPYPALPKAVIDYRILISENGGAFSEAGETSPAIRNFTVHDFKTNKQYCFVVKARLEDGLVSLSDKACLLTEMERAPDWINADYATIVNNKIALSFSFDPLSEIAKFRIERKKESETAFTQIDQVESTSGKINFTDETANPMERNSYRLTAVNNCGNPVVFSNTATNMVPHINANNNILSLSWNSYWDWLGGVSNYKVYMNTGSGFQLKTQLTPADTFLTINYSDIMYQVTGNEICFYIAASENENIHNISGESISPAICIEVTEKITVPNAFTPDDDNINDLFKPVLSFTPSEYLLIITDRNNNILFSSSDPLEQWDGKKKGDPLPAGVYLWFLKVRTPSGKQISKTGTVTVLKGR